MRVSGVLTAPGGSAARARHYRVIAGGRSLSARPGASLSARHGEARRAGARKTCECVIFERGTSQTRLPGTFYRSPEASLRVRARLSNGPQNVARCAGK